MKTLSALQVAHYGVFDLWYKHDLLVHKPYGNNTQEVIEYALEHGYTHIRWEYADGSKNKYKTDRYKTGELL